MGCPHCKLLDASESESHENVIANVAAKSADTCEAIEGATANSNTTPSVNQYSNLVLTESGVAEMDYSPNINNAHISNEAPITSLIDLCDIDSNILDSTERLEVNDGITDLTSSTPPPTPAEPEAEGPSSSPTLQDRDPGPGTTNCTTNTAEEQDCNEASDGPAPVRRNRGTVRVNSIRGHKVGN